MTKMAVHPPGLAGMRAAIRQWASGRANGPTLLGSGQDWARELAVGAVAGVFLGLVGPFGSYLNRPRAAEVLYWMGAVLVGTVLFGLTLRPAIQVALRRRVPVFLALALSALLVAAPMSLLSHAAAMALWPGPIGTIGPALWYGQTVLISAPLAVGYWLSPRSKNVPPPVVAPAAGLLGRLPAHLGRDLLALQMEDHYVRAHTAKGSALILIPLRQAMAELAGRPGLQVHRSWWVANSAVVGVRQDGRNVRLVLSNGVEAPVSRTNLAAARAAGLTRERS